MFKSVDDLIQMCIDSDIMNVPQLANIIGYSEPWVYKYFKKHNVSFKRDITDTIKFINMLAESQSAWITSCGSQWDEVKDDTWVPYNEGTIEYGESGSRRSITHRIYKGRPYSTYVFIPDNIPDDILKGCGEDYYTNEEYKYVFVSPEGDFFHSHKLKPMCEKLGIKYQAASDCVRGKSVKTNADWVVKYTRDFY